MRFKPKGHKIYHQKTRFERLRAFVSNTGAVILTLAIMGVLGFVGYSAGGPVLRFLQDSHVLSPPPPPGRAIWMLAGWGREAPRRSRDSRVRPCPGCFLNGEVGECGGGWKKEGRQQLRRQVKVGYPR